MLIVQGLIWMDRRCFCFLLLRPYGSSRRFRFFVTVATGGTGCELLASVCAVRCLFVGRGEPSSVTHLCGTGSAASVPAAAAVAIVLASVPTVSCSCCLRCCFAGLGDGSRATQRWGTGSVFSAPMVAASAASVAVSPSRVSCCGLAFASSVVGGMPPAQAVAGPVVLRWHCLLCLPVGQLVAVCSACIVGHARGLRGPVSGLCCGLVPVCVDGGDGRVQGGPSTGVCWCVEKKLPGCIRVLPLWLRATSCQCRLDQFMSSSLRCTLFRPAVSVGREGVGLGS